MQGAGQQVVDVAQCAERFSGSARSFSELLAEILLGLGWANLGGDGGARVARAALYGRGAALTALDMSMNGLTNAAGIMCAEGLKENTSLRLLDLSRNRLGARTAEAFAASLRRNCTLRVLKLGWNVLGTPGTSDVIRSLSERGSVAMVELA